MQGPLTFRHPDHGCCRGAARSQGQSAVEYLVIVSVLLGGVWGAGLFGEQGGLLALLLDALRGFHHRFTTTLSLPL
ncbi:hypothetical protein GCM10007242_44910 [Pigmentiphaga litoralis]|uniref:hypothetical protein n=1 Tax=Pigmentiphaga litoralis TaxID=516702 RepID=UPI001673A11E|nr:hypothetical protein [Pigmentiphaga litoralis]GGX32904.1 hypothetical protein GCM10007242_44910 [Pigmentiphaga litoralis]